MLQPPHRRTWENVGFGSFVSTDIFGGKRSFAASAKLLSRCIAPGFLDTFLVHIELSVFEVDRRQHTVSDMFAFRVIEHFDVVEDVLSGLLAGLICSTPVAFPFEQVEEALSDRVEAPIFVKP